MIEPGETFYQYALKYWAEQDRVIKEENKKNKKMFQKILNTYIVLHKPHGMIVREILEGLEEENGKSSGAEIARRDPRFVIKPSKKDGGRSGDGPQDSPNVKQEDPRPKPRKDVHYRWKDKSGKNNTRTSDGNGSGKAG